MSLNPINYYNSIIALRSKSCIRGGCYKELPVINQKNVVIRHRPTCVRGLPLGLDCKFNESRLKFFLMKSWNKQQFCVKITDCFMTTDSRKKVDYIQQQLYVILCGQQWPTLLLSSIITTLLKLIWRFYFYWRTCGYFFFSISKILFLQETFNIITSFNPSIMNKVGCQKISNVAISLYHFHKAFFWIRIRKKWSGFVFAYVVCKYFFQNK
jgi:hypothetical protein